MEVTRGCHRAGGGGGWWRSAPRVACVRQRLAHALAGGLHYVCLVGIDDKLAVVELLNLKYFQLLQMGCRDPRYFFRNIGIQKTLQEVSVIVAPVS